MNLGDVLRGLWRRWYIVLPGLVVTVAVAIGAWLIIPSSYERSGTQLLLPGIASIPEAGNPYLYLGGLSQASDVLVTAMSSEQERDALLRDHPGADIVVARDPMTSGPQLLTTVTARTDAEAGEILDATMVSIEQELDQLQKVDGITSGNRMSIKTITVDSTGTAVQKNKILGVAGAALLVLLITLLTAGLVEGLSSRRRRLTSAPLDDDDPDVLVSATREATVQTELSAEPGDEARRPSSRTLTRQRRPLRRTR